MSKFQTINASFTCEPDESMFLLQLVDFLIKKSEQIVQKKFEECDYSEKVISIFVAANYTLLCDLTFKYFSGDILFKSQTSRESEFLLELDEFVKSHAQKMHDESRWKEEGFLTIHNQYFQLGNLAKKFLSEDNSNLYVCQEVPPSFGKLES